MTELGEKKKKGARQAGVFRKKRMVLFCKKRMVLFYAIYYTIQILV